MIDLPPLTRADLIALGQRIRVPHPIDETAAPEPGQIWRARWDDVTTLVVVLEAHYAAVLVAPFFLEFDSTSFEDEEYADFTGRQGLVLRRHAQTIAPLTLDVAFGTIALSAPISARPVIDADLEADMVKPLGALAAWTRQGEGDGTLRDRLRSGGLTAGQIASSLHEPLAVAAQILRNTRPVTYEQAEILSTVVSLSAEEILASNPTLPAEWQTELLAHASRAPIQALARQREKSDSDTWRSVAYGAYALAARQGNDREAASVRARIQSFLQSELVQDD